MILKHEFYEKKYTNERIVEALQEWQSDANVEPQEQSIKSSLYSITNNGKSNLIRIVSKKLEQAYFNFGIRHFYLIINNKYEWHPGNLNVLTILEPYDEERENNIIDYIDLCHYCTYWFLSKKFMMDKLFDVMTFNCEIILGKNITTLFSWTLICLTLILIFCQDIISLLLFFLILIGFILYLILDNNAIKHYQCKHLKKQSTNIETIYISNKNQ